MNRITWGIAGAGKLGSALLHQWNLAGMPGALYHPDEDKRERYAGAYRLMRGISAPSLSGLDCLLLALPPDRLKSFPKDVSAAGADLTRTTLVNLSTSLHTDELRVMYPDYQWAGVKFAGHASRLKTEGAGAFVMEDQPLPARHTDHLRLLFERIAPVISAEEAAVWTMNQAAVKEAVTSASRLSTKAAEHGYPHALAEASCRSTLPGTAEAYLTGSLGAFGRKVAEELEER
ncbi:hypothetical protein [Alkalicoccus chagannorensis]|uniref:hypothetical protein n=1 Tax=Alkalicoccus chagannorensis TaxID=427072 RepID=UPI00041F2D00|nr:hypothetical protein [Alkalicoccus chagannorensis]